MCEVTDGLVIQTSLFRKVLLNYLWLYKASEFGELKSLVQRQETL